MSTTANPRTSRGLFVALGVVAGVGLLSVLYVFVVRPLLTGGEPVGSPGIAAVVSPSPTPGESPAPGEDADDPAETEAAEPVPETFEVFSARDPFQQLVARPASTGGGAGQASPSPSPTGTASPSPTGSPTAPPDTTVGATTVRLVDVFTDDDGTEKILVTVNGTGYEVAEGETFASRFQLLDITGDCATLLFGDSRFTLCKGEQIRK